MSDLLMTIFKDETHESQTIFRRILYAMSEPAQKVKIETKTNIFPLESASIGILFSLLDNSTAIWLSPKVENEVLVQNLFFHCSCQITKELGHADFIICLDEEIEQIAFEKLKLGTERYPDQSATIIVQFSEFRERETFFCDGPGILGSRKLLINLSDQFLEERKKIISFPMGIDFIFTCQNEMIALPRTTQVKKLKECDHVCSG